MSGKLTALADRVLMKNYQKRSLCLTRGRGAWVWDDGGHKYLDLIAGIAVNSLGHRHPALLRAVRRQIGKMIHASNMYLVEPQIRLADLLVQNTFADRVFFCNSGAESVETAIKIARKYFFKKKQERDRMLSFTNSFHGRTVGSLSLTSQRKYQDPFEPLLKVDVAEYNNLKDADKKINSRTAAVFVELVQGEGGMSTVSATFLAGLRRICSERGAILIYDEVQTGNGRSGELFAYQNFGEAVAPDVLTTAKGLAGGIPIGAVLARKPYSEALSPGDHGSTFGGNPLACSAGIAVVSELLRPAFRRQMDHRIVTFWRGLQRIKDRFPNKVQTYRGMGMMAGLVFKSKTAAGKVKKILQKRGVLVGASGKFVLRMTPPLIISERDLAWGMREIEKAIGDL